MYVFSFFSWSHLMPQWDYKRLSSLYFIALAHKNSPIKLFSLYTLVMWWSCDQGAQVTASLISACLPAAVSAPTGYSESHSLQPATIRTFYHSTFLGPELCAESNQYFHKWTQIFLGLWILNIVHTSVRRWWSGLLFPFLFCIHFIEIKSIAG